MASVLRILISSLLVLSLVNAGQAQQPVRVVIRVDDIQSRNTTTLPRSIVPFQEAVTSRGGRVTWVTIPHRLIESQNTNGVLAQELRVSAAGGHEVAQHGYNHICQLCGNTGHEMWCATRRQQFSYTQQLAMIHDGTSILLDSVRVTPMSFVSPGHVEDTITYAALANAGFRNISTTQLPTGQVNPSLYNLGSPIEYTWNLTAGSYTTQLRAALADARRIGDSTGVFVLLLHDPFIRQGFGDGIVIRWTGEFLDSLRSIWDQRLRLLTLAQAIEELRGATAVHEQIGLPPHSALEVSNYPNPFNPWTLLHIRSRSTAPLQISIANLLGQVVLNVGREVPATIGTCNVTIDAGDLPSGVYFAVVQQGYDKTVRKILLQK